MFLFQCSICSEYALYCNQSLLTILGFCADCAEDIPHLKVLRVDNEECEKKEALDTR